MNCAQELLKCMEIFKVRNFDSLILLPPKDNYTERLNNTYDLNPTEIMFDLVSIYQGQLKESVNQSVATFSLEARKNKKYPVFYLYTDVNII